MEERKISLVVDANVLFAAIISPGKAADLLFDERFSLQAPDFILEELRRSIHALSVRTKRTYPDLERIAFMLLTNVEIVPLSEIVPYVKIAEGVSPDPEDVQYFALALKTGAAIWSNDKLLKEQQQVRVYSTCEVGLLGT